MPGQLEAVLFDLDDTLIDWSGVRGNWRDLEAARLGPVHRYLAENAHGFSAGLDQLIENYWQRTRNAWSRARVNLRAPNMPELLMATLAELGAPRESLDADAILAVYNWDAVPGTAVYPDVPPTLELLRNHGLKTGIVTNASQPMWMRDAELRTHGLIDYFPDCRLSGADAGYLKPHPRIFKLALETLGTAAEDTIFVGDNPVADIGGAQAAGMRAIRRFHPRASLNGSLAKPHQLLHSLAELPAILDAWHPDWRARER